MKFGIFLLTVLITNLFISETLEARDLNYKFGMGYRQAFTSAVVDDDTGAVSSLQLNGIEMSYGFAQDIQASAFFGFLGNFDFAMFGPKLRYDFQRAISRDASIWEHLNLFVEAAFLVKTGKETKSGIALHAPYFGIEVLPLKNANLAILSSAGLVVDFIEEQRLAFTNGMFGDVGLRYYF